MTSSSSDIRNHGYTLLEILLAMGLGVIVALVSVPALEGWWSEHRMRSKADELITLIRAAKLQAEMSAESQVVILLAPGDDGALIADSYPADSHTHMLARDGKYLWKIFRFSGAEDTRDTPEIHVDAHGYVDPISFRVSEGEKFVVYRIDFLTGHAREQSYSF